MREDHTAFLYSEATEQGSDLLRVGVKETHDQGETWNENFIVDSSIVGEQTGNITLYKADVGDVGPVTLHYKFLH